MARLPKAAGRNPDGKLNNWLPCIFDFQNYDQGGQPLPHTIRIVKCQAGEGQVAVMAAFSTAASLDPKPIAAEIARLRIDGQSVSADRVFLPSKDMGTYRSAAFVFQLRSLRQKRRHHSPRVSRRFAELLDCGFQMLLLRELCALCGFSANTPSRFGAEAAILDGISEVRRILSRISPLIVEAVEGALERRCFEVDVPLANRSVGADAE